MEKGSENERERNGPIIIIAAESDFFPVHTHFPCSMKKSQLFLRFLSN